VGETAGKVTWRRKLSIAGVVGGLALSFLSTSITTIDAAEDAKSIYLPGFVASLAGFVPPPGTYFLNYKYFYSGSAAADSVALNQLGNITLEAEGCAVLC